MGLPRRSTLQGTQTRPLGGGAQAVVLWRGVRTPFRPPGGGARGEAKPSPPHSSPFEWVRGFRDPRQPNFFSCPSGASPRENESFGGCFLRFFQKSAQKLKFLPFSRSKIFRRLVPEFFFALCNFFGRRGSRHLPLPARLKPGMAYGTRPRHSGAFGARSHDKASIDPRVQ